MSAVTLKRCRLTLDARTSPLKIGAHTIPKPFPSKRGRVMARRRGIVRLAGLLVPRGALRSLLEL